MYFFSEAFVLLSLFLLYWWNRERRRYFRERIGSGYFRNLYNVGRNVGFMLRKGRLKIKGRVDDIQRGSILYSFHFGVWESMPRALRRLGYNVGVVVNRYSSDRKNFFTRAVDRFLYRFRSACGVKIFYRDDAARIVKFLKDGGVLGILVDGNNFYSKFSRVEKLSRICNAPLIPFAAYRKNGSGILEIGCDLDRLVKEHPFDYVWFYKSRVEG